MDILGDRRIRLSEGEVVTLQSDEATLSLDRLQPDAAERVISITAPPSRGRVVVHARASAGGSISLTSSTGANWKTVLSPGANIFQFVVEPRPDEYYSRMIPITPLARAT